MTSLHRRLAAAALTTLSLALGHAGAAGLTRAEVREDLRDARAMNTMTPSGEIGDTPEVLAARETFNALQTEVMAARAAEDADAAVVVLLLNDDY